MYATVSHLMYAKSLVLSVKKNRSKRGGGVSAYTRKCFKARKIRKLSGIK